MAAILGAAQRVSSASLPMLRFCDQATALGKLLAPGLSGLFGRRLLSEEDSVGPASKTEGLVTILRRAGRLFVCGDSGSASTHVIAI